MAQTKTRASTAGANGRRRRARPAEPEAAPHAHPETPAVCPVAFCPICAAVSAVNKASPEVVEHLLSAAREFFLAAKAVMDARATELDERDERPSGLEHIDIA